MTPARHRPEDPQRDPGLSGLLHPGQIAASALIVLAGINWWLEPSERGAWGAAIAAGLTGIVIMAIVRQRKNADMIAKVGASMMLASLILGVTLLFAMVQGFGWFGEDIEARAVGVIMGIVMIVAGNFVPKTANPAAASTCSPARRMRAERFAGWTFVLTGVVFTGIWLLAPIDTARLAGSLVGLAGILVVIAGCVALTRPSQTQ